MKSCGVCDIEISNQTRSGMCLTCYSKWYQKSYRREPKNKNRRKELDAKNRVINGDEIRTKHRDWSAKNRDRLNESHRAISRRPYIRYNNAVSTAKRRGISWDIKKSDYMSLIDSECTYCLGDLSGTGSALDRVDNSIGYTLSNVVPCCGPCNRVKGNVLTFEEMKLAMDAVIRFRQKNRFRLVLGSK